jgi:hypothetical protein
MKSFEQLGQAAYDAFHAQVGNPLAAVPHWSMLSDERKAAWTAAAMKVVEEVAAIH